MTDRQARGRPAQGTCLHLLAMPLESNFSGAVYDPAQTAEALADYPEDLLGEAEVPYSNRWLLLLDAAKACATRPPDLSRTAADFVVSHSMTGLPACWRACWLACWLACLLANLFAGRQALAMVWCRSSCRSMQP